MNEYTNPEIPKSKQWIQPILKPFITDFLLEDVTSGTVERYTLVRYADIFYSILIFYD